ncbi:AHH domain-containing protein [Qipengyuania sp. DGS5-3]|uniref:AHH domain-containing protein n=1 Tax=Qipengyuania sp. DGS5-3 TaxID=3349632 RepID=UPI0036D3475D
MNRCGCLGYDPDLQRHHLIPSQALRTSSLSYMLSSLGKRQIGFDDFRRNGMLLPSKEPKAQRMGLPLHRGPHRAYNEMVIERLGMIEQSWSRQRAVNDERANQGALMQISLLQRALQRRLLDARQPMMLNRKDPLGRGQDFTLLDAMAEQLWSATH